MGRGQLGQGTARHPEDHRPHEQHDSPAKRRQHQSIPEHDRPERLKSVDHPAQPDRPGILETKAVFLSVASPGSVVPGPAAAG